MVATTSSTGTTSTTITVTTRRRLKKMFSVALSRAAMVRARVGGCVLAALL